jgi:hypothetical protein
MFARLLLLGLALTTLAGCYVAPAPPRPYYGNYYAPAYRPYGYGGYGYGYGGYGYGYRRW